MRSLVAGYYAMITHLDSQIGRIRQRLEETGEWENTIVVFSSDNGIAMGRHGCYHKQTSHDHDAHVPLIISGPGIVRRRTCAGMIYLYDLFPTLCDLAGLKPPDSVEGRSLRGMLQEGDASGRDVLYHAYVQNWRAVYDGRYRFLVYAGKDDSNDSVILRKLLFDMDVDSMESNDIAGDPAHAGNVKRLEELLRQMRDVYAEPPIPGGFWNKYEDGCGRNSRKSLTNDS